MNEAKEAILTRTRQATSQASEADLPGQRTFHIASNDTREAIIDIIAGRVLEYRARLARVDAQQLAASIAAACADYRVKHLVAPADIPDAWLRWISKYCAMSHR